MDAEAPSRRRWQSHEWNVLLVIALVAAIGFGWLAWQAGIVRHRRAMRAQIEAGGGRLCFYVILPDSPCSPAAKTFWPADRDCPISKVRELLGDKAIALIRLPRELTAIDRDVIEAFPEAQVAIPRGAPLTSPQPQATP